MNTILKLLKRILGFPNTEVREEPYVAMRESRDCHVAAVATACDVSYDTARKALWHWDLPFWLESPIFSNPWNVKRAIESLGFEVDESLTVEDLIKNKAPTKRVIVLVHNPESWLSALWMQHWVVWFGKTEAGHRVHWGKSSTSLVLKSDDEMRAFVNTGWPTKIFCVKRRD